MFLEIQRGNKQKQTELTFFCRTDSLLLQTPAVSSMHCPSTPFFSCLPFPLLTFFSNRWFFASSSLSVYQIWFNIISFLLPLLLRVVSTRWIIIPRSTILEFKDLCFLFIIALFLIVSLRHILHKSKLPLRSCKMHLICVFMFSFFYLFSK